jgi:competence protein ComEA
MQEVRKIVLCVLLFLFTGTCAYAAQGVINVNKATQEELMMLPGIGEKTAKNIISYRQANGPFKSIDQLTKVKGLSRKKLDKLRPALVLDGETTYLPVGPQKAAAPRKQKSKG